MSHYRPRRLLAVLAAVGLAVLAIAPAALSRPASGEAAAINLPIGLLAQVNPPPEVTVAATDAAAAEAGANTGTFTVTRSGDTTEAITVNYSVGGTATSGDDFQALSGSVNLAAGATTATVTVTPIDDSVVEGDETVILTLGAGTGYAIGSPSQATVTIADNDPPVVSIVASDANASEAGADTGTFTVSRTGPTTDALTVNYSVGGTASAGDFNALSGSVTIPANASSATIVVAPVNDAEAEGDESVVLTLQAGTGYALGSPVTATVTISDDDLPQVNIRATDANAAEAGSNTGTFQISRTGPTTSALTVLYMVGGTAAQADYNPVLTGSVTIPAGQSTVNIVITPVDDAIDEGNETVILSLTASGLYSIGADNQATVTIADDDDEDEEPPPTADRSQKEECKKGGWQNFANLAFKNQGDCVSYFATGGKNPPNG